VLLDILSDTLQNLGNTFKASFGYFTRHPLGILYILVVPCRNVSQVDLFQHTPWIL